MNGLSKPHYCCGNCYCNSGQGIECIRRKVPHKSCSYLTLKALVSLLLCRNFRTILGYSILLFWFFFFLYRKYILFCSYWIIRPKYIYIYIYVHPWKLLYCQLWKKPGALNFLFFLQFSLPNELHRFLRKQFLIRFPQLSESIEQHRQQEVSRRQIYPWNKCEVIFA